jgi:high mobility group protein B1
MGQFFSSELPRPSLPLRPRNSFIFFTQTVRHDIMEENPELTYREIFDLMKEMWFSLSREERQPYEELARADKERYEHELEELVRTHGERYPQYAQILADFRRAEQYRRENPLPSLRLRLRPRQRLTLEDKILAIGRSDDICAICHSKLNEPDGMGLSTDVDPIKLINCQHKFHKSCILSWARSKRRFSQGNPAIMCPMCGRLSFGRIKRRKSKSRKRKSRSKLRKRRSK